MASSTTAYLTIDVGGTYLKSAVLSQQGMVFHGSAFMAKSPSCGSRDEIMLAFADTITRGLEYIEEKRMKPGGIGLAFPGPFDYAKGIPLMEHKFRSLYGFNLREAIYNIQGVPPTIPIRFIHDANAVLAGEIWKGNAEGFNNAAVITLGTGLGFAFSENWIVQCNNLGGPLVTIFKLPYKDGILEDYASKRGFLKIYSEISGKTDTEGIKVSDIGKWADGQDKNSIRTFSEVGRILASSVHDILIGKNIQCLLLAGQISRSFSHMEESLKQGLHDVECLRKISAVKSIENAALLGVLRSINYLS